MKRKIIERIKEKKGITLIALVITIIVLLILAAVSIATLTGENGILTRAQDAKTNNEIAEEKEAIGLAYNGVMADSLGTGVEAEKLQNELRSNGYTNATAVDNGDGTITVTFDSGRSYTIDADGNISDPEEANIIATMRIEGTKVTTDPPMPNGNFEHVDGTIDTGYVIRDTTNGNEFVWVPVDKNQRIEINVTSKEDITSITLTDPAGVETKLVETNIGKSYSNTNVEPTINGPYVLKVSTATEESKEVILGVHSLYAFDTMLDWTITDDFIADMTDGQYTDIQSFLEYGSQQMGYEMTLGDLYIMLEAQENISAYSDTEDYTGSVEENGGFYIGRYEASYYEEKVASKKSENTNRANSSDTLENGMLWNYVSQEDALRETKNMYSGISTLLTRAAWDRTLGWLEETGAVTSFEIVADSSTWGNYADDEFSNTTGLINTGEYGETEKNHIYDLAGNLYELTTETYNNTTYRVYRGRLLRHFRFSLSSRLPQSTFFFYQ